MSASFCAAITSPGADRTVACANAAPLAEPLSRRPHPTAVRGGTLHYPVG